MATIILDRAASNTSTGTTELTPQDGDICIIKSNTQGSFTSFGGANVKDRKKVTTSIHAVTATHTLEVL